MSIKIPDHWPGEHTPSQMSVYTHVPSRATQALSFPIWYVLLRLRIPILLRHPKVNDMYSCMI